VGSHVKGIGNKRVSASHDLLFSHDVSQYNPIPLLSPVFFVVAREKGNGKCDKNISRVTLRQAFPQRD
jgi:hypothetical protein